VGGVTASLSIVLPAHNEEGAIVTVVEEVGSAIAARFERAEIVVVDDASTDGTAAALAELAAQDGRLRVLRSETNRGHGPSVLRGLAAARGDWIFQLDSDGQSVVPEFWDLWDRHRDADVILGFRRHRRDPVHRLALSRVVAVVVSSLAGRRLHDPNVPFRLFRRVVWEDLRTLVGETALAPSILMSMGAALRGWRIVEVPVSHRARRHGRSSLRAVRLVAFSLRGLAELVRFRVAVARAPARAEA
jgi:dolichol-phosphate mannosyltransferase